jgi:hypothetical protein
MSLNGTSYPSSLDASFSNSYEHGDMSRGHMSLDHIKDMKGVSEM